LVILKGNILGRADSDSDVQIEILFGERDSI
jgi:hypothetical protein